MDRPLLSVPAPAARCHERHVWAELPSSLAALRGAPPVKSPAGCRLDALLQPMGAGQPLPETPDKPSLSHSTSLSGLVRHGPPSAVGGRRSAVELTPVAVGRAVFSGHEGVGERPRLTGASEGCPGASKERPGPSMGVRGRRGAVVSIGTASSD